MRRKTRPQSTSSIPVPHGAPYSYVAFLWSFPEFEKYQRGRAWYVSMGILALLLIIHSLATYSFLFLVIVLLIIFILYLYHIKEVEQIIFKMTNTGLVVDRKFHPWKNIKSFYIIYEPPHVKNLYFEVKPLTTPNLIIPLEDQNPLFIREYLLQFLIEDLEKESEPFADKLGREMKI